MLIELSTEYEKLLNKSERSIMADYYWTYHHSQADTVLQQNLMTYLIRSYPSSLRRIFRSNHHSYKLVEVTKTIVPPKKAHKKVSHQLIQENHQQQWPFFQGLAMQHREGFESDEERDKLISSIFADILRKDVKYQTKKRPGKREDSHESFLRSYAMSANPRHSGSLILNDLYSEIQTLFIDLILQDSYLLIRNSYLVALAELEPDKAEMMIEPIRRKIKELRRKWNKNHKNQEFLSDLPDSGLLIEKLEQLK